ncbi:MAG: CbiX/SirB N-terminal domain-containing protein [Chloroflexota bacterium]
MSDRATTHIVLAGPASNQPQLLAELRAVAAALSARLGWPATAAWFDQGRPPLPDVLRDVVEAGARRIVVVPYLLQWRYPDHRSLPALLRELQLRHPGVSIHLAEPVGLNDALLTRLIETTNEALQHDALTDQDLADRFGVAISDGPDVDAPLSVRALPHAAHVLVCQGQPCLARNATAIEMRMRDSLETMGRLAGPGAIRVTRTRCIGACATAPVVAAYPGGEWFHTVTLGQVDELLHRIADQLDRAQGDSNGSLHAGPIKND